MKQTIDKSVSHKVNALVNYLILKFLNLWFFDVFRGHRKRPLALNVFISP